MADEEKLLAMLSPGGRVIRFPAATNAVMWPFYYQASAKKDENGRPIYRYAYGDRFIDRSLKQNTPTPQIVHNYLTLDIASAVHLERLVEMESASEYSKEANCHVKLRDFIEARSNKRPMFHTPNHPVQEVICDAAGQILTEMKLEFDFDDLPKAEYPVTSGVSHPVHPGVIRYFNLPYYPEQHVYRMVRGKGCTFEEFISRYIEGTI